MNKNPDERNASTSPKRPLRSRREVERAHLRFNPYPKTMVSTRGGIMLLALLMTLFGLILIYSLFKVQIFSHGEYSREAAQQHYEWVPTYPERGSIVDQTGLPLAITTYEYTVGFTPKALASNKSGGLDGQTLSRKIGEFLNIPATDMDRYYAMKDQAYVLLKNHVNRTTYDRLTAYLKENAVYGVVIDSNMRRQYPEKTVGAAVVGFANKHEQSIRGITGVESSYDSDLRGTPGYTYKQVDNYGGEKLPFTDETRQAPIPGNSVKLHIYEQLQQYCEELLHEYATSFNVKDGGEVIVMDPHTGAVLAMANENSFDLNDPFAAPTGKEPKTWNPYDNKADADYLYQKVWENRSISRDYEPGSTYKAFTAAAALEEKAVSETQTFSDEPIWVEGWDAYPISCWSYPDNHGWETLRQGVVNSCNPILVQTAQHLGMKKFWDYVRAFGHRDLTGIDLPAESNSIIHLESEAQPIDLATWAFGEQSVITPLQLINGFCTFANGGQLMTPHVADKILDPKGNVVREIKPQTIRQVISPETASKIMNYLLGVVEEGYMENVRLPGYRIAGKTSTSNYDDPVDPAIQHTVLSFCGIAPYENPRLVVLSILHDTPPYMKNADLTRLTGDVMARALQMLGVKRQYSADENALATSLYYLDDLGDKPFINAARYTLPHHIRVVQEANAPANAKVKYQYPAAGQMMNNQGKIYVGYSGKPLTETVQVPDFKTMDYSAALQLADKLGLNIAVQGDLNKTCTSQDVSVGTKATKYTVIPLYYG